MKVVITGGPCSGKTTLVNALAQLNYRTLPEVAIQVIQQKINELGKEAFLSWRSSNLLEFQSTILATQKMNESNLLANKLTILDRGTIDNLAYLIFNQIKPSIAMVNEAIQTNYELIIVCETLNNFDDRLATGRTETYQESKQLQKIITQTYINLGYNTIILPLAPLEQRISKVCALLTPNHHE